MTTRATFFSYCLIVHSHNGNLLTIEQTKKILNNPELSDEQLTEIRDGYRLMAEVIFEKWIEERKALSKAKLAKNEKILPTSVSAET